MLLKNWIKWALPIGLLRLHFDSGGGSDNTTTATTMNYSPEEAARRTAVMDEALRIYNRGVPVNRSYTTTTTTNPVPATVVAGGTGAAVTADIYGAGGSVTTTYDENGNPITPVPMTSTTTTTPAVNLNPGETPAYVGQTPTGPSDATRWAQDYTRNAALGFNNSAVNNAMNFGLNGAMDVNNNPYLASSIQSAIDPITKAYSGAGGSLSQVRSGANEAGQFGGSRQGIAEGAATEAYLRQVGNTSAKMSSDAYNKGLDTMTRTLAMSPDLVNMNMLPAEWMSALGASQEGYDANQAAYDAAAREWNLNYPWLNLQNLANLVYGSGSMGGTTRSTSPGYSGNPLVQGLGLATMGAGLYNNVAPWFASSAGAGASDAAMTAALSYGTDVAAEAGLAELGALLMV